MSDRMLPDVYRKTKGAGLPSTSLMNSLNDMNVIRYPQVKLMANPVILW